jgi:hypothetical protein
MFCTFVYKYFQGNCQSEIYVMNMHKKFTYLYYIVHFPPGFIIKTHDFEIYLKNIGLCHFSHSDSSVSIVTRLWAEQLGF